MILLSNKVFQFKTYSDGSLELINPEILAGNSTAFRLQANIKNSDDLIKLILAKSLVDKANLLVKRPVILSLPYVPYMRSDRAMSDISVGGLKTIAPIINNLNFDRVVISDPHSDVTEALLNNAVIKSQSDLFHLYLQFNPEILTGIDYVISPDAGALKKVSKCAELIHKPHIEAFKVRELSTNKIIKTSVNASKEELKGKTILAIDDILEYGGTLRELAKTLKEDYGVAKVIAYVTHGVLPINKRLPVPSRINFILDYIDSIHCYYLWSNPESTEEKDNNPKLQFKELF